MPTGLSDDELPWTKSQTDPLQNKNFYGKLICFGIFLYANFIMFQYAMLN